jgi:hypothetical protein
MKRMHRIPHAPLEKSRVRIVDADPFFFSAAPRLRVRQIFAFTPFFGKLVGVDDRPVVPTKKEDATALILGSTILAFTGGAS